MWSTRCCCSMGGLYWAINAPQLRGEQVTEQTNSDLVVFAGVRVHLRSQRGLQPFKEFLAAREDRLGFAIYSSGDRGPDSLM